MGKPKLRVGQDSERGNTSNVGMPDMVIRWVGSETGGNADLQVSSLFSGTGYIITSLKYIGSCRV